jgi:hypothetical protein
MSLLILSFSVFSKYPFKVQKGNNVKEQQKVVIQHHNARCRIAISSRLEHGEYINMKMAQATQQNIARSSRCPTK